MVAQWKDNTNWLSDKPIGRWYGVTTDADGHVQWLDLSSNDLSGSIPPELGNLTNLESLHLSGNQLTGSIPPALGSLTNLGYLNLSGNDLSGSIPPALGSLTNLGYLNLSGNDLSGSIPPELGNLTNLQYLFLGGNDLSGSIPPELGNLTNLEWMFLGYNQLTGCIPNGLRAIPENDLSSLGLDDCSAADAPESDRAVLVALYNATNGAQWEDNTNWLSDQPLDQWYGVTTDADGRVSSLNLGWNDLSGSIPLRWAI